MAQQTRVRTVKKSLDQCVRNNNVIYCPKHKSEHFVYRYPPGVDLNFMMVNEFQNKNNSWPHSNLSNSVQTISTINLVI